MATIGGQDYTGFRAISLRGSTQIAVVADGAIGTLKAELSEGLSRAWTFPNKSGTFPITGTFTVNMPAITSWGETMVTVSGIRAEDALTCSVQNQWTTVTTGRTFGILTGARPQNGYIYLTFYNPTGTATLYGDIVVAYTAAR